jgi:hypothetical protein
MEGLFSVITRFAISKVAELDKCDDEKLSYFILF